MSSDDYQKITEILDRIGQGRNYTATAALFPLFYRELRTLAGSYFQRANPKHTLQPTALVHEAFIKLTGSPEKTWENRAHFLAVAAKAMRQILSNHAQAGKAAKRGGGKQRITLSGLESHARVETDIDLLDLEHALGKLEALSPRKAQIVEMRFLAGLEEREVAQVLNLSISTIQREWRMARAFLNCELSGESLL